MSFSSGTFSINSSGQPVVTGTVISSTAFNTLTADIATGLSTCVLKDGTQTITGNIPMAAFKFTGLGSGSARTDSINIGQVEDGFPNYVSSVGGTADVITLTPSPAITAYAAGQVFRFIASGANTTAVTVNVSALGAKALTKNGSTALVANDITSGALLEISYDGTRFQLRSVNSSIDNSFVDAKGDLISASAADTPVRLAVGSNGLFLETASGETTGLRWGNPSKVFEARLSLTTAVPVTTTDVTAATTLYLVPYKGDKVALYDGTNWRVYTLTEISIAVPATTDTGYDVWLYDNAGTLTLELLAWTNLTTRATAIAYQNGVEVKTGVTTRRLAGSFRTTGVSGQTEDSFAKRYLNNRYNQVERPLRRIIADNSWAYTTATVRQANGDTANQVEFFQCLNEHNVRCDNISHAGNATADVDIAVGIGLDATDAFASNSIIAYYGTPGGGAANIKALRASFNAPVAVGSHKLVALEYSEAAGSTSFYGDNGGTIMQSGMVGSVFG